MTSSQVCVHILEARKLAGAGINPLVKVTCGKEKKWTRARKGTNNPFFDEVGRYGGGSVRFGEQGGWM